MSGGMEAAFGAERRRKEASDEALGITKCVQCGGDVPDAEKTGGLCGLCYGKLKRMLPAIKKLLEEKDTTLITQ